MNRTLTLALTAALAIAPSVARAQLLPIPSAAVVGGVSRYVLTSSGSTPFGAFRVEVPLAIVVAEASVGFMRPSETGGPHTYVIPEVQLQYQVLPILVRPYVGVGGGIFRAITGPDPHPSEKTISAAVGVRATLPLTSFGVRAEARVRGIGRTIGMGDSGFGGRSTELTVGLSF